MFRNSWGNSYIPCLLLIIAVRFTCGEKNNLLMYQNVPKYYEHGFVQNFLLLLMSLLTALIVKNSYILTGIYFIFQKKHRRLNLKSFQCQIWTSVKRLWKHLSSKRQILELFCILVALILGWNCVKGLRVTNIVKKINWEEVWGELEAKNCLQREPFTKYLRQTLDFKWNNALREKFKFVFSAVFC